MQDSSQTFEKIIHLTVPPTPFDCETTLLKPFNKQAPVVLCGSIMRQFFVPVLSKLGHPHRIEEQGVTVITYRHGLIVAVTVPNATVLEQDAFY